MAKWGVLTSREGKLFIGERALAQGETIEIYYFGAAVRGRVEYRNNRYAHRLALLGGYWLDLQHGMDARLVLEE
jgi:hypothetical protein